MKKRVITGVILALIIIPIIWFGDWFMIGMAIFLSYVGTLELVKMHTEKKVLSKKYQYIIPIMSVWLVTLGGLIIKLPDVFDLTDMVFSLIIIFFGLMIVSLFNKELKTTDLLLFFGFIAYCGIGLLLATSIRQINTVNGSYNKYIGLVLTAYVFITNVFTDMGAFQFGVMFGKHKLCPTISPKKTVEGAIAGSITGMVFGSASLILGEYILHFSLLNIENNFVRILCIGLISLVLTVIAQFGDLVASKLKREYGIKDYGFIFPGHGGVMDRFDSLIMTGSFFFVILSILGVILC